MRVTLLILSIILLCSFIPKKRRKVKANKNKYSLTDSCQAKYNILKGTSTKHIKVDSVINIGNFLNDNINSTCFQNLKAQEIIYIFGKPIVAKAGTTYYRLSNFKNYDSIYVYTFSRNYTKLQQKKFNRKNVTLLFCFKNDIMQKAINKGGNPNAEDFN